MRRRLRDALPGLRLGAVVQPGEIGEVCRDVGTGGAAIRTGPDLGLFGVEPLHLRSPRSRIPVADQSVGRPVAGSADAPEGQFIDRRWQALDVLGHVGHQVGASGHVSEDAGDDTVEDLGFV